MKLNLPILFAIFIIRHANSLSFHAFEKTPQQWELIRQENITHQRRYKQQNLCEYNQENHKKTEKPLITHNQDTGSAVCTLLFLMLILFLLTY